VMQALRPTPGWARGGCRRRSPRRSPRAICGAAADRMGVRRRGALRRCAIVQNGDVGAARGCAATAARRVRRRTPATACSLARWCRFTRRAAVMVSY